MATFTAYLAYSPAFERPNVWRLGDSGASVRIRAREAIGGPEHVLDVPLSDLRPRRHDDETWVAGPLKLSTMLGQVQLILRGLLLRFFPPRPCFRALTQRGRKVTLSG